MRAKLTIQEIESLKKRFPDSTIGSMADEILEFRRGKQWLDTVTKPIEPHPHAALISQFEHDVKFYGNNAYLMWDYENPFLTDDVFDCNNSVIIAFKENYEIVRKNSAALPFDLERAIAGDVLELLHGRQWITVKMMHGDGDDQLIRFSHFDQNGKVIWTGLYLKRKLSKWLRMKYPKVSKQ